MPTITKEPKRKGKIERLTPEQEAELPAFRQRYLDIACGGGRIDRPALEAALADAYAVVGKPAPKLFIFDSPAACMLALKIFKMPDSAKLRGQLGDQLWDQLGGQLWGHLGGQLGDQLWDQLRGQLGDQLWDQLRGHLGGQLGGQLRDQLRGHLGGQLGDQLWDQLGGQLWGQLRDQLRGHLGDQLRGQLWDQLGDQLRGHLGGQLGDQLRGQNIWDGNFLWGSQDLYWVAWARFAQQIGVKFQPKTAAHLDIMERISTQCEWWWPHDGIVIASERPRIVRFDDERRLHREDGPAIEYNDGYALYAWHGTRIPENWITDPSSLTAKDALVHENIEQRRAACEILGWARILRELDAKVIDADADPLIGELVEAQLPDLDRRSKFLRVQCGTGREFAIGLPPEIKTALEGQAWLTGLPVEQFQLPTIRT